MGYPALYDRLRDHGIFVPSSHKPWVPGCREPTVSVGLWPSLGPVLSVRSKVRPQSVPEWTGLRGHRCPVMV